jgi:hypothetical protein
MSREIKFRVWDGSAMYDATAYPDWSLDNFVNMHLMAPEYRPDPERYKLMQFTGLKDKNGKEIYEGDILSEGGISGMRVVWAKELASFALTRNGWMYPHYFGEGVKPANCSIVGNVHENPELLKP